MLHWKQINLGDFIITNKKSIGKDDKYTNIEYLETGSISRGKITNTIKIALENAPSRARRILEDEDIIYSSVRPINRHYGFFKKPKNNFVVSTGFITITCNKSIIYPLFLYHYLTQDSIVEQLDVIAEGSTSAYPCLLPSDIEALEVLLPPLPEQKAIAGVLGSLDGKIDLLQRQNATLEATAETLFRQWFIEEAQEDWNEHFLSSIVDIKSGFAFKSSTFTESGKFYLVTIKAVQDGYLTLVNADRLDSIPTKMKEYCLLKKGDILLSLTGNIGRCCMVDRDNLLLNQRVALLSPRQQRDWAAIYTLFRLSSFKNILIDMGKGTAQSNLSPIETSNMTLLLPEQKVFDKFSKIATPLLNKFLNNRYQIRTLEKLRDTLLPKLMSGEVRVRVDG